MRLGDLDALKEVIEYQQLYVNPKLSVYDVLKLIDNAPAVSDRYDEGYAQGYIDGSTGADMKGGAE